MSEVDLKPEAEDDGGQLDEDDRLKPEFVRAVLDGWRRAIAKAPARWSSRCTPPTSPICSS